MDDGQDMSPSDRGEMLKKAEDFINAHKESAVEGQTSVNILIIIIVILLFVETYYQCYLLVILKFTLLHYKNFKF